MSELIQSALHPDADQLAAFAEQALPAHEREDTLAHLATCADCRRVVFLAQDAAPVEVLPVPVATGRRWFPGWNLMWPAVAALAGMLALTIHLRSVATTGTPAHKVAAGPVPAPVPVQPPPPVEQPPPVREETAAAGPVAEAKLAARPAAIAGGMFAPLKREDPEKARQIGAVNGYLGQNQQGGASQQALNQQIPKLYGPSQQNQSALAGRRLKALTQDGEAPAATMNGAVDSVSLAGVATGQAASHGAAAPGPVTTGTPAAKPGAVATGQAVTVTPKVAMAAAAPQAMGSEQVQIVSAAPPPPPPPAQPARATQEITANSVGNLYSLKRADAAVSDDAATTINSVAAKARAPLAAGLPSRLPALSTVTNGARTVAVDNGGSVFLSKDSGQTWKAVGVKWAGRPVQVSVVATSSPGKPGFELRTDTGVVWTSSNGQSWKRQ